MQLYTDSEQQRRAPRRPSCAIRARSWQACGDVLMLSSTWTHSHFPKHNIEPYTILAHPTAATFASIPTIVYLNYNKPLYQQIQQHLATKIKKGGGDAPRASP